ncbi:MAG: sugar ABC transporter ATP-binding protein [Oscillospiraceae bacterium]|nr:sugar ABC transporter ATP-binding protein [Oscillospiraceae bacterium]
MLELKHLSKAFDGHTVLNDINLTILPGKVHGLIGANGSGKSTLMNILNGNETIARSGGYTGRILLDGRDITIQNHSQSVACGIAMVHQELALFSGMTVTENIKINREKTRFSTPLLPELSLLDPNKNVRDAQHALEAIGAHMDPGQVIDALSLNQKQFVELARELDQQNIRLLILDEPTSSLNITETKALLSCIREIADRGIAVIFISHRLEEIMQVCDTVSVLRDGALISTYEKADFSIGAFADDMVGRKIVKTQRAAKKQKGDVLMQLSQINGTELDIREGEVLGITGLAGQGQELLAEGLFGLKPASFQARFKGEKLSLGDNSTLTARGIYYLSDDRAKTSLFRESPVWKNMIFGTELRHREFLRWKACPALSLLDRKAIQAHAQAMIEQLNIICRSPDAPVRELSGGNQQKVCVARALTFAPELLFVNEPTRGIDIYSKELILDWLLKMNERDHTTVVITSGELEELVRVCDRVVVMYQGQVFQTFEGEMDLEELTLSLYGRGNA